MPRSRRSAFLVVLVAAVASAPTPSRAATSSGSEHRFVAGAGSAVEATGGAAVNFGGSAFLEWTAVEEWLELELGIGLLRAEGGVELPVGLLLKKPFRLSRRAEVMLGLGPELVAYRRTPHDGNFVALEGAVDVMVWPTPRVGFSIEPSYEWTARGGGERSFAGTAGIIFGW